MLFWKPYLPLLRQHTCDTVAHLPCRAAPWQGQGRRSRGSGGGVRRRGRRRRSHCGGAPRVLLLILQHRATSVASRMHSDSWRNEAQDVMHGMEEHVHSAFGPHQDHKSTVTRRCCQRRAPRRWAAARPNGRRGGWWVSFAATGAPAAMQVNTVLRKCLWWVFEAPHLVGQSATCPSSEHSSFRDSADVLAHEHSEHCPCLCHPVLCLRRQTNGC